MTKEEQNFTRIRTCLQMLAEHGVPADKLTPAWVWLAEQEAKHAFESHKREHGKGGGK
jgi:hypothetical protein